MIALLCGLAFAADGWGTSDHDSSFAVDGHFASTAVPDRGYDAFSQDNALGGFGLAAGYAPGQGPLIIRAGWDRLRHGREWTDANGSYSHLAAFVADQLHVGARIEAKPVYWWRPYAEIDALAMLGRGYVDPDPEDDDSPGEVKGSGAGFGGRAVAGMELSWKPVPSGTARVAWSLDAGYGLTTAADLGDLGSVATRGFVIQSGLGVRF